MKLKIVYKLVVLVVLVTAVAVGLMAGLTRYSINSGFSSYVARAELSRIDSLVPVLEWEYASRKGWHRLQSDPDSMWWLIAFNERRNGHPSPPAGPEANAPRPRGPTDGVRAGPPDFRTEPGQPGADFIETGPPPGGPPPQLPPDRTPPVLPLSQSGSSLTDKNDLSRAPSSISVTAQPLLPDGSRSSDSAPPVLPLTGLPSAEQRPAHLPPPFPPERMEVFRRLGLFNANRELIWGNAQASAARQELVLKRGRKSVGYLKLAPVQRLSAEMDRDFVGDQNRNLLGVCILSFSLAALAGLVISQDLVGAISILVQGTRQLTAGNYATRIYLPRSDELGQLAQDFNTLSDALEQHDRSHRQWIADTSHELRTPLAVLRAQVEALQDGVQEANPKTLAVLHNEIMTLNKLVDDLYLLAKSDVGKLQYHFVPVDAAALVLDVLEGFEERFNAKTIEVDKSAISALPVACVIEGDSSRLRQLFSNLFENSLRYTDAGGKLRVVAHEDGNALVLWFDDSHPGIADAHLPKIFERFFRGDLSRSRDFGGAGLGLAICRTIVDGHGGTISAFNSPLGGLRVELRFPLSEGL